MPLLKESQERRFEEPFLQVVHCRIVQDFAPRGSPDLHVTDSAIAYLHKKKKQTTPLNMSHPSLYRVGKHRCVGPNIVPDVEHWFSTRLRRAFRKRRRHGQG